MDRQFNRNLEMMQTYQANSEFGKKLKTGVELSIKSPELLSCVRYQYKNNKTFRNICNTLVTQIGDEICLERNDVPDLSEAQFLEEYMRKFAVYANDTSLHEDVKITASAAQYLIKHDLVLFLAKFVICENIFLKDVTKMMIRNTVSTFNKHKCYVVPNKD